MRWLADAARSTTSATADASSTDPVKDMRRERVEVPPAPKLIAKVIDLWPNKQTEVPIASLASLLGDEEEVMDYVARNGGLAKFMTNNPNFFSTRLVSGVRMAQLTKFAGNIARRNNFFRFHKAKSDEEKLKVLNEKRAAEGLPPLEPRDPTSLENRAQLEQRRSQVAPRDFSRPMFKPRGGGGFNRDGGGGGDYRAKPSFGSDEGGKFRGSFNSGSRGPPRDDRDRSFAPRSYGGSPPPGRGRMIATGHAAEGVVGERSAATTAVAVRMR